MPSEAVLRHYLADLETPRRRALSLRYPWAKPFILFVRHTLTSLRLLLDRSLTTRHAKDPLPVVVARHQSVLIRTLGSSNLRLQQQKIQNLRTAIRSMSGIVIRPGETLSFWKILGKPTRERDYVDGMLLSRGEVIEGLGGGLCQLANFLTWIFLHTPSLLVERHHHSYDVFPDSGRTLPFGSGATVLYNFVDLKIKNVSDQPLQILLWLTDTHLKGEIRSTQPLEHKLHVVEQDHCFAEHQGKWYRYNELWREELVDGKPIRKEKLFVNFAPVLYEVTPEYLEEHQFQVKRLR